MVRCGKKTAPIGKATDKSSTTARHQPDDSSNLTAGRELTPEEQKVVGEYEHKFKSEDAFKFALL